MPLLSPRSSATAIKSPPMDDDVVKKPKGVMGRLKSTFKLGRRKSSTGSTTAAAAAAATAVMEREDDKDAAAPAVEEPLVDPVTPNNDEVEETNDATEIKQFTPMEEEADEPQQQQSLEEKNDRVATFELSKEEEKEEEEEQDDEEVFACDYKPGEGPRVDDAAPPHEEHEEQQKAAAPAHHVALSLSDNQSPLAARSIHAPHESDLVIVGVSPAKLVTMGPSVSPLKRSHAPPTDPLGPSRDDTTSSLGDRIATARSSRPGLGSQLLSDFSFGTDDAPPSSPVKRHASPQQRRTFQREHDAPLSINASASSTSPPTSPRAQRKPDTPSTMPSVRAVRSERRSALEGITEETASRPRPSNGGGRRRAPSIEAPILASAFAAPEVPEEHELEHTPTAETVEAALDVINDPPPGATETATETDDKELFAFDAGAAITTAFGDRVARLLGADPWGDRQDGFDAIVYHIKKTDLATAPNRRELLCAALAAIHGGVDDRVAPVLYCALESLRSVLKEFASVLDRSFLKYAPMNEQLSLLAKTIVGKLGDSNKRTQREASNALVRLAKLKKLKALPHVLLHLSAKDVAPRQRVEILRLLVKELGVEHQPAALNVEVVMQFAVPVLKIADEKTRKGAVELIAQLHVINGQAVNAQLAGVKPEMLRVINRRVDELLAEREREREAQAPQNANQAEEAEENETTMALVSVPVEDSAAVQTLLTTLATQAQGVVGPVIWRKLESKTWSDRKDALVDMEKSITEAKSDLRDVKPAFQSIVQHNFLAYCTVIHRCLCDAIAPVVNSAMDAFATLVKVYGPCVEWREDAVRDLTLLTIARLLATMQKPNTRTNRAACRCILKLTRLPTPHPLRFTLSCVLAKDADTLVQMHLLRLLIPEFGFQSDGLSAIDVLAVVAPALGHSSDKVRKTATDVVLCTQRLVGKELVLKKLTDIVKPVTLKELEKLFVDVEVPERPQTVHATSASSAVTLPPVQLGGDRRLLNSAPVGLGKLHCTPPHEEQEESEARESGNVRRASVLSRDEENLMDAILGGDDF